MNNLIPKHPKPTANLGEQDYLILAPQGSEGHETVESIVQDFLSPAELPAGYQRPSADAFKLSHRRDIS